jgi:hypothetical protein
MSIKITCINDKNKPNDISNTHWVKQDEEYTPVKIIKSKLSGDLYFVLEEVKPDNPLYGGYNINRFAIMIPIEEFIEENELELIEK